MTTKCLDIPPAADAETDAAARGLDSGDGRNGRADADEFKEAKPVGTTDEAQYLAVPKVAKILGISRVHAYALIEKGEIPAIRLGSAIRIPRTWLDALAKQAATPKSQQA